MQEEYCKLLNVSRNTYYVHKRENRPIVSLIEKYFTEDDLQEFLETGSVSKYDTQTPSRIKKLENIINIELLNRIERLEQQVKELQK